ncbi:conserved protein of unknown function [Rhodovastum atsumiense]|uniref:PepSY domain-containing protein n=1 Tax=Rhodovastum atsumiense TaxID=504468 RepID=A0A5M6IPC5_9PROT|nr:hypothetical protein [Rhodovastum atsumiense]KAA5610120.1 hypothetical protein F1189_21125 [Rhodovastum atsumiense]CAH2601406.1 conserved protein of unknown function [Rhodovastum atsumiense]
MEVKEAVAAAKACVRELFVGESIANIGLEEVAYDEAAGQWHVTIGFARPWEMSIGLMTVQGQGTSRSYKVIAISDRDGRVVSVRDRDLSPP